MPFKTRLNPSHLGQVVLDVGSVHHVLEGHRVEATLWDVFGHF